MIKLCRFSHEEKEIFFSSKMYIDVSNIYPRGVIGGKTGKTAVLSGFCKIELGDIGD